MIAVVSMFRTCSTTHVQRYWRQVEELAAAAMPEPVRVVAVEGDSTNDTRGMLRRYSNGVPWQLVIREHGGPHCGSVATPERMRQVSFAANGGLDAVTAADDVVVWVESDLLWEPETIVGLIARVRSGLDVVAPAVFVDGRPVFYDIWGYRDLHGRMFSPLPPYAAGLETPPTEVSSVGSCLAMHGDVARRFRLTEDAALVGFCADLRRLGHRVWVDWSLAVRHPT